MSEAIEVSYSCSASQPSSSSTAGKSTISIFPEVQSSSTTTDTASSFADDYDAASTISDLTDWKTTVGFRTRSWRWSAVLLLACLVTIALSAGTVLWIQKVRAREESPIRVVRRCFPVGEPIQVDVTFEPKQVVELWVGILEAGKSQSENASEDDYVAFEEVTYSDFERGVFVTGSYRAVLVACASEDCSVVGRSSLFTVAASCVVESNSGAQDNSESSSSAVVHSETEIISLLPRSRDPTPVQIAILQAAQEIRQIIRNDPAIGPKFVRLGFHDCVGGCDGCVDMSNADNNGLTLPIESLQPTADRWGAYLSRADIWALAALVGADVAQEGGDDRVDFSLEHVGRVDCESEARDGCRDRFGRLVECTPFQGPHRSLPHADITTADLFHFFAKQFGFNDKETVALMGAHTLGSLARENSGFDAEHGWVKDNLLLDNDYFVELVGGQSMASSQEEWVQDAPNWVRRFINNDDLPGIPDRFFWHAFPENPDLPDGVEPIVMLTADIALVREIDETNLRKNDGVVSCAFRTEPQLPDSPPPSPRCPHAERSLRFAAEYRFDNALWLNDFEKVFKRMLIHGYDLSDLCYITENVQSSCR